MKTKTQASKEKMQLVWKLKDTLKSFKTANGNICGIHELTHNYIKGSLEVFIHMTENNTSSIRYRYIDDIMFDDMGWVMDDKDIDAYIKLAEESYDEGKDKTAIDRSELISTMRMMVHDDFAIYNIAYHDHESGRYIFLCQGILTNIIGHPHKRITYNLDNGDRILLDRKGLNTKSSYLVSVKSIEYAISKWLGVLASKDEWIEWEEITNKTVVMKRKNG